MTNRVTYSPQDFKKMCLQAERDHESRKLVLLLERVKKQIASRENAGVESPKPPVGAASGESSAVRQAGRLVAFER